MIRGLCIVCLLSCTFAGGQSLLSASAAESPATLPNRAHAIVKVATVRPFAAASIKLAPVRKPQINAISIYPDGGIVCAHCTLHFLAALAYDVPDWQVADRSEWMGDAQFDLEATTSEQSQPATWNEETPLTDRQRQMLRALLKDRFRMEGHRETRTGTVYILQRSDQPLKLAPPSHPWEVRSAGGGSVGGATGIAGKNISMRELATRIGSILKRPIVDRTGLSGTFDFDCGSGDTASAEVTDAVFDSLRGIGLKLMAATVPVEMLVIDHADPPAEN